MRVLQISELFSSVRNTPSPAFDCSTWINRESASNTGDTLTLHVLPGPYPLTLNGYVIRYYHMGTLPKTSSSLRFSAGPIRRERLHDQITRAIALQILRGEPDKLAPMLTSEIELSRRLNVSRTVLRESVKVLAAKGLLEVRPKTGMRIRPRSEWNLLDPDLLQWQCEAGVNEHFVQNLCELRFILEPAVAELAGIHALPEEIDTIQRCFRDMERSLPNFETFVAADVAFHQAISAATHNDLLIEVNRTILQALRATQGLFEDHRVGAIAQNIHEMRSASLPLHKQVAQAVAKRDPQAARAAMCLLIKQAEQDIYLVVKSSTRNAGQSAPSQHHRPKRHT